MGIPTKISKGISIHALREEGDYAGKSSIHAGFYFYPRPPRGGRRDEAEEWCDRMKFLSTPSARRATFHPIGYPFLILISIHALREEGDIREAWAFSGGKISIHALREEGDTCPRPTPTGCRNFYPRPPRGGRRFVLHGADVVQSISIHALREEGDLPVLPE